MGLLKFICKECRKEFNSLIGLNSHISQKHNRKDYYDRWLKKDEDNLCKICRNFTEFIGLSKGYKNCCSKKCTLKYIDQQAKISLNIKYGGNTAFCKKETHEKSKITLLNKYGVNHNLKIPEVIENKKQTWLKNLGVDNPSKNNEIKEKKKKTCLKNYGIEYGFLDQEKCQKTLVKNYGVKNAMHDLGLFQKQQKKSYYSKKFKDTNIDYRGSYELDFLENFYDKIDIENAPPISYLFEERKHVYYPDFYILLLNLIIEIKSVYTLKEDKSIKNKKEACLKEEYNYIMILDKNYLEFEKILNI